MALVIKKSTLLLLISLTTLELHSQEYNPFRPIFKKMDQKDYIGALADLNIYLKEYPKSYGAYYNRAYAKFCLYGMDSAMQDYTKSSELGFGFATEIIRNYRQYNFLMTDRSKEYYLDRFKYKQKRKDNLFTRKDSLRGALRFERTCFDVKHYDLSVKFITYKRIEGKNKITFYIKEPTDKIQLDLFSKMKISKILFKDKEISFKREFDAVFIQFPEALQKNSEHNLTITYYGKPVKAINPPWEGGFDIKKDKNGKPWVSVACEHLGASAWWPNKDHLSDEPDSMNINLIVPDEVKCVSNGTLTRISDDAKRFKKYEWKLKNPINNYNATFYLGDFVHFEDTVTSLGKTRTLHYYVLPQDLEKAKIHFKQTKEVIQFYEEVFGEYAFWNDKFAMVQSSYAGMEHQGAIAIGGDYGENNDDRYHNGKYDYLIVHEVAHEWWGNSVSVGDMADVWIHEGFATYAEMLFIERKINYQEYLLELSERRQHIFNFFPVVGKRDVNYPTLDEGDIYPKGAQILHNLRCSIDNDSLFFNILKSFQEMYKRKIVSSQDFISHVNSSAKKDYTAFFSTWLNQASIPVLRYKLKKTTDGVEFTYRWINVDEGFEMPFGILVNNAEGKRLVGTLEEQTEVFKNISSLGIPTGWNPAYKFLPRNSFTYFEKREITD